MKSSKIIAAGKCLPRTVVDNDALSKTVDTNDDWIVSRTGIHSRRIADEETTLSMALQASKEAIEHAGIDKQTIDLILVATITPDTFMPSTAALLQHHLGISGHPVTAFDLNAACTGFIYALQTAHFYIQSGQVRRALVVGSETMSKALNWEDRSTCVLFGDGAGAVVLEGAETGGIIASYTNARGDIDNHLTLSAFRATDDDALARNGGEIFKFAPFAIRDSLTAVLEQTNRSVEDLSMIIPHQANVRILKKTAKQMGIDFEKFYVNLHQYGNTSSASIAIALAEALEEHKIHEGDLVALTGFGGGLTWGSILHQF
ncbi:MAG TPA: 3-oxoacyl-ACP synthase [Eubacteriaceae bacterium]|nr:3-oxoacyl-ACP synthase [Eubacteriaceae bacterium]